ncbi:glycoside hydrolase family 2 protein [Massilia sp. TN1-12]|uniref:glycoside hydrolase family 2 protein n=1 Tax=Massilia paldalensis TaxID=3377675 RepID=UPI00384B7952
MRHLLPRLALPAILMLAAMAAHAGAHAQARPGDVQLAGTPAAAAAASRIAPPIQNIQGRSHVSLNGRWSYIIDPYETGYYDYRRMPFDASASGKGGFYDDRKPKDKTEWAEYSFDLAPTLKIPGDWNSQAERLQLYEGTVWMRQVFDAEPKEGKHYMLYFGAVNYEAHVYLNGKKLGVHRGGFTPFQFDVTGLLAKGRNVVVVKADNTRHQEAIPTLNTDWWNYGGITRDVLLAELPSTYIADYKVQLAKGDPGRIAGYVQLAGAAPAQQVTVTIPEAGIRATVRTGADGRAAIDLPAGKLQRWTPQQPKLYAVELSSGGDTVRDRIGFRTIATRGHEILLNGKPVFLRGVALHDENPLIPGRLRGAGDMRMLLQWAKELNCNYVRLAHYPHSEEMLRLADEMGLMVWAEVPVYWTISWDNPDTYANASAQLTDLIVRDKNRASVVIWSVGNETPIGAPRNAFMGKLARTARALDDTRLVAAALEIHRSGADITVDDPLAQELDLISFNEYAGWYWSSNADMLNYRFDIKADKPVVITEFGADALAGYHADADTRFSEEYQDALYRNQFRMFAAIPSLRGITPWVLADFRSPRRPHPYFQDFWNRKGLVSETGKKKMAYWTLKEYYDGIQKKYEK